MVALRERLENFFFFQTNLGISDLRKSKKDLIEAFCERIQENKEKKTQDL